MDWFVGEGSFVPGIVEDTGAVARMHTGLVWAANLAWTAVFAGFTRWRYQRLDIDR